MSICYLTNFLLIFLFIFSINFIIIILTKGVKCGILYGGLLYMQTNTYKNSQARMRS